MGLFLVKTEKKVGDRDLSEINYSTLLKRCASLHSNVCSFLKVSCM